MNIPPSDEKALMADAAKADKIVGVCSGEETQYIFAEWRSDGLVHGRPISVKRLREMGVSVK